MSKHPLIEAFEPRAYNLDLEGREAKLVISGRKLGRPSKRITFHQKDLRILSAKIWRSDKKEVIEIPVRRINHHKNFEEVRLHADNLLFPGHYKIELVYKIPPSKLEHLKNGVADRSIVPMIDESKAFKEIRINEV